MMVAGKSYFNTIGKERVLVSLTVLVQWIYQWRKVKKLVEEPTMTGEGGE
jgi:hypothetical protein